MLQLLIAYLVVITIYLTGCLIIHLREIHDEKRSDQDSRSGRSAPRRGGSHAIRL
jgi:hypothetical protein